jgi:hypothetical protein
LTTYSPLHRMVTTMLKTIVTVAITLAVVGVALFVVWYLSNLVMM